MGRSYGRTQRERILDDLRAADPLGTGRGWVCGNTWLRDFMPRYAAVICLLRKDRFGIEAGICDLYGHDHMGNIAKYRLYRDPERPMQQQTLAGVA